MGRISQLHVIHHFRSQSLRHVSSSCSSASRRRAGERDERFFINSLSHMTASFFSCSSLHLLSRKLSSSPDFSHLPGARMPKVSVQRPPKVLVISKSQADDAFKHCLELLRKHDVDTYLAMLIMPKRLQPELITIHAFNVELATIRDKVDSRGGNDTTGMYRLQFWKDALSSIYGESHLPIPRQPVAIGLCSFAPSAEPKHLESLIISRQQTLGDRPFNTVFEVAGYGARTAGALMQLQSEALLRGSAIGDELSDEISKAAVDIGGAFGIANLIRSTLPLLARGVVLLPLDVLSLNNLTPDKLYKKKQPDDVRHAIRDIANVAVKNLESGKKRVSSMPKSVRPAFVATAARAEHILRTLEKLNYDVYSPYLQRRNPLLLWTLIWRSWLGRC